MYTEIAFDAQTVRCNKLNGATLFSQFINATRSSRNVTQI